MVETFRVKCIARPSHDGYEDSHVTKGKFYNVMDVTPSDAGVEFFWVKGDIGESVWRAASWFSRPMRKKVKNVFRRSN